MYIYIYHIYDYILYYRLNYRYISNSLLRFSWASGKCIIDSHDISQPKKSTFANLKHLLFFSPSYYKLVTWSYFIIVLFLNIHQFNQPTTPTIHQPIRIPSRGQPSVLLRWMALWSEEVSSSPGGQVVWGEGGCWFVDFWSGRGMIRKYTLLALAKNGWTL